MRINLASLLLSFALVQSIGTPARAESEVYNGGTCVPYPAFNASNAVPYAWFLYGFRQSAHCHITMASDRRVADLRYVVLVGSVSSGSTQMRVRLCVFTANGFTQDCGSERQITSSSIGVAVLYPPATLPSYAQGAYIRVSFPSDVVSTVQNYVPVWEN